MCVVCIIHSLKQQPECEVRRHYSRTSHVVFCFLSHVFDIVLVSMPL